MENRDLPSIKQEFSQNKAGKIPVLYQSFTGHVYSGGFLAMIKGQQCFFGPA